MSGNPSRAGEALVTLKDPGHYSYANALIFDFLLFLGGESLSQRRLSVLLEPYWCKSLYKAIGDWTRYGHSLALDIDDWLHVAIA